MIQEFSGLQIDVTPTNDHRQWFMTVEEVSKGYEVDNTTIMRAIQRHADEIRDGIERGTTICRTLGGPQQMTVLYREGVIRLGFFVRSGRAAMFRQWATDLIIQCLDAAGITMGDVLARLEQIEAKMQAGFAALQNRVTTLESEVVYREEFERFTMTPSLEQEAHELIATISQNEGVDGRSVIGWLRGVFGTSGIYNSDQLTKMMNLLRARAAGKGIRGLVP